MKITEIKKQAEKQDDPADGCGESNDGSSCCCGIKKDITEFRIIPLTAVINTPAGQVKAVPVKLRFYEVFGNLTARLGLSRNNHAVEPGLYAIGAPDKESPVFVSANYKMSFDSLRRELCGINAWILVLDTKGVNVWCAAGKGTFGTFELVKRIIAVQLHKVVNHRKLIVPQLGAPGIAAHQVKEYAKFNVVFGPVEAKDIKEFLDHGMKAGEGHRTVTFGLLKRLEVLGIEFITAVKIFLGVSAAAVFAAGFTRGGFSAAQGFSEASYFIAAMFVTVLSATVIPAALLPVLPGKMFSVKGAVSGFIVSCIFITIVPDLTPLTKISLVLMSSAVSSFVFMNYTGTSTFTSLSGVKKEIFVSVPVIITAAVLGLALQITDFIIKGAVKWN